MGGRVHMLACQIEVPPMSGPGQRDAHLQRVAEKVRGALTGAAADDRSWSNINFTILLQPLIF